MVVAGVEELLSFDPNIPPRAPAVDVVLAAVGAGVELVFPNKLVDWAGFAAPPKIFEVGVCEAPPNIPPEFPLGVAAAAGVLLVAPPPNNGFCSPGLDAVFPNKLVVGVVDEAPVGVLLLPPRPPKEKLGVPVEPPKRPPEALAVDEPNNPPEAGALDVVALLDWAPELVLPKNDIVW